MEHFDEATTEEEYKSTEVTKVADPFVDLGNLVFVDNDPCPADRKNRTPTEEELSDRARDNAQYLINKVWGLDVEQIEDALVVTLPKPSMRLPREKALPSKRELTKWEQYAQEKGIRKKKKDSKVFDEQAQEWKPRYGYRRGNDNTKDWLIEIPDHKDPMADYFAERIDQKKERVQKNEMQRLRNIARQMKARNSGDGTDTRPLGVTVDLQDRSKHELINQISRAKFATASHGKFQQTLKDEVVPKKTGKTRQFAANEGSVAVERKRQLEILDALSAKKPKLDESRLSSSPAARSYESSTGHQQKRQGKGERPRHKSAVHRQQHFQMKVKAAMKKRGNVRAGRRTGRPRNKQ